MRKHERGGGGGRRVFPVDSPHMNRPTYGDPDGPWINRVNAEQSPRGVQRRAKARKLRQAMSLPEVLLWQELRRGSVGWRFRRQHSIGPYVADFYCHEVRFVLEVDGESHIDRRVGDVERDRWLMERGYVVKRISAERVLKSPSAAACFIVGWMAEEFGEPRAEAHGPSEEGVETE